LGWLSLIVGLLFLRYDLLAKEPQEMNVQIFYEYIVLRDLLAFTLPGGICLFGIGIIVQALGNNRWTQIIPPVPGDPWVSSAFLILVSFLIGHVLDFLYRKVFQGRDSYKHPSTIRKLLGVSDKSNTEAENDPLAMNIRDAVGEFLEINWEEVTLDKWITSGKAFESNFLLRYWIEQQDAKLFSTEVGRFAVEAHILHSGGMAFVFLAICSVIVGIIVGTSNFTPIVLMTIVSLILGFVLIKQGGYKRGVLVEHVYRVFYVLWRRRTLEEPFPETVKDEIGI